MYLFANNTSALSSMRPQRSWKELVITSAVLAARRVLFPWGWPSENHTQPTKCKQGRRESCFLFHRLDQPGFSEPVLQDIGLRRHQRGAKLQHFGQSRISHLQSAKPTGARHRAARGNLPGKRQSHVVFPDKRLELFHWISLFCAAVLAFTSTVLSWCVVQEIERQVNEWEIKISLWDFFSLFTPTDPEIWGCDGPVSEVHRLQNGGASSQGSVAFCGRHRDCEGVDGV